MKFCIRIGQSRDAHLFISGFSREDRPYCKEPVLNFDQIGIAFLVNLLIPKHTHPGVELVDRSICFNTEIRLRNPLSAKQGGRSIIASFRIDLHECVC